MPCFDGRDRPEEIAKEFRHNSPVAEMLCGVITTLLAEGRTVPDVPGLVQWWVEHQRRDADIRAAAPRTILVQIETLEMTQSGQRVRVTFQTGDEKRTETSDDPDVIRGWYEMARHAG